MFGLGGEAIITCSVFRWDSWFQTLKAFSAFGSFFPRLSAIFFQEGAGTWSKITSHCLRSLIDQLSLLLVPNMVLSKMNNHEHRTKQTWELHILTPYEFLVTHNSVIRFCEFLRGVIASYTAKDKFSINTLFLNYTIQLTRTCSSITRVSWFASACVRTQNIAAHRIYVTAMRVGRTFVDV